MVFMVCAMFSQMLIGMTALWIGMIDPYTFPTSIAVFFCLIILAFDLYRSWRRTFCSVFPVRSPRSGGSLQAPPLPSAQACPKKEKTRPRKLTKERTKEMCDPSP